MNKNLIAFTLVVLALPCFATHNENASQIAAKEFFLPAMSLSFDEQEIDYQARRFKTKISFENAMRKALSTILNDSSDIESPLALMTEEIMDHYLAKSASQVIIAKIRGDLYERLNLNQSTLSLVTEHDLEGGRHPLQEDILETNWVFLLTMPHWTDHSFFVVIDRDGTNAPYVYGFN